MELPSEAATDVSSDALQTSKRLLAVFLASLAAYFGWLGLARKTRRVLSAEYHEQVIKETLERSNDLAGITKAALLLVGVFVVFGAVSALARLFA